MVDSTDSIARVRVTAEQLRRAVSAIRERPSTEGMSLNACVKAIVEALIEEGVEDQQELADLCSAICARLMAFAALMGSAPAKPWLAPPGIRVAPSAERPILEVMATAPLRIERGRYKFDTESFFEMVLERSPVAGCG